MSYNEGEFAAARRLWETPVEHWLTFFKCAYCGTTGTLGNRLKGESSLMHSDCFSLYHSKRSEPTPLDLLMNIEEAGAPKVIFDKNVFNELASSAIVQSPLQYNYFLLGEIDGDSVKVRDFALVPFFTYLREPGTFGEWAFKDDEFGKDYILLERKFDREDDVLVGYLHSHNARTIGQSDLYYEYFYSHILPEDQKENFKAHIQLNTFYPTVRELVLANHKLFSGRKHLIECRGWMDLPTLQFEKYLQAASREHFELFQEAKKTALNNVLSKPEEYMGAYTTIPQVFAGEREDYLFEQLEGWMNKPLLEVDTFANLELIKRIQGRIKKLPFEIRSVA